MSYLGDFVLGDTLDFKFTTVNTSGVPTTLTGTPVISAYPGNSTTELTAGIALTADFDSRTGLNHVRVVASSGNGYAVATDYKLVITAGTVSGNSVVGYVVGEFSIQNRITNLRFWNGADLNASGIEVPELGIVRQGTAQSVSGTTVTIDAPAAFGDNTLNGCILQCKGTTAAAYWQSRIITASSGDAFTINSAFTIMPTGTITYRIFGVPAADDATANATIAKLDTALELDGAVYRFTTNALEQAPSAANYALVNSGTFSSGSTTTGVCAALTQSTTDFWRGNRIKFTSGSLNKLSRKITGFDPATDTLTWAPALPSAASTETFEIYSESDVILVPISQR